MRFFLEQALLMVTKESMTTSPTISDIRDAAYASSASIPEKWRAIFTENTRKRFIAIATNLGKLDHYKFFPQAAKDMVESIRSEHGVIAVHALMRSVLLQAIIALIDNRSLDKLPPRVLQYQRKHLYRIAKDSRCDLDWLDISHDLFHKEFGLTTLRLFAAGAQLVDIRCGIPRSVLFNQGLGNLPKRLWTMAGLGGFKPYFQLHTHSFNLDQFHEQGWNECYRCCAELYALYPQALGMFGSSWFFDPALELISPRLSYLRKIPGAGGAHFMSDTEGRDTINNALSTSATRRDLYEKGQYNPIEYMLIWGRKAQITWARQHNGSTIAPADIPETQK